MAKRAIGELKNGLLVTEDYHGSSTVYPIGTKAAKDREIYKQQKNENGEYVNHGGDIWGKSLKESIGEEAYAKMTPAQRRDAVTWNYFELPPAEQAAQDFNHGYDPRTCVTEFSEEYKAAWKKLCAEYGVRRGTAKGDEYVHPLDGKGYNSSVKLT